MSDDDLKAEVEQLRARLTRVEGVHVRGITLKVSEKGGVTVYGLGRQPVTLYKEQWINPLAIADDIRQFIQENETSLKAKDPTP